MAIGLLLGAASPASPAFRWSGGGYGRSAHRVIQRASFVSDFESVPDHGRSPQEAASPSAAPLGRPLEGTDTQSRGGGGLGGAWNTIRETPVVRRVAAVGGWVADGLRLMWAIPKAVVRGDSRALIEAIGDLLSRASADAQVDADAQRDPEEFSPESRSAGRGEPVRMMPAPSRK